jgi:hypothetical protein
MNLMGSKMTKNRVSIQAIKIFTVGLAQLVMTQVFTFFLSLLLPETGNLQQTQPLVFCFILGITFAGGIFAAGWIALSLHWLDAKPRYWLRLALTTAGTFMPLLVPIFFTQSIEQGSPYFFISIISGIIGFHIPGLLPTRMIGQGV